MPCYQIQRTKVQLKAENAALLRAGLEESSEFTDVRESAVDGALLARHRDTGAVVRISGGTATVESRGQVDAPAVANAVNRAYSVRVVKTMSTRFGWALKDQGENRFVATKRIG